MNEKRDDCEGEGYKILPMPVILLISAALVSVFIFIALEICCAA